MLSVFRLIKEQPLFEILFTQLDVNNCLGSHKLREPVKFAEVILRFYDSWGNLVGTLLNQISFGSCTHPFSEAVSLMWELHVRSCNCSGRLFRWSILGTISWMLWKKFLTILVAMSSNGLYLLAWQNGCNCQIAVKLLACQHHVHRILHDWHCKLLGLPHTSWEVGFGHLIWSGIRPPFFKPLQICIWSF